MSYLVTCNEKSYEFSCLVNRLMDKGGPCEPFTPAHIEEAIQQSCWGDEDKTFAEIIAAANPEPMRALFQVVQTYWRDVAEFLVERELDGAYSDEPYVKCLETGYVTKSAGRGA